MANDVSTSSALRAKSSHRWSPVTVVCLIAIAALWPALLNGGPFYMPDTPSYVRGAASGFFEVLGIETAWASEYLRLYEAPAVDAARSGATAVTAPSAAEIPVTLNGRSIFYGVFLYLSYLAGSLWTVVLVQSLLAAACIYLTVDGIGRASGIQVRPHQVLLIGLIIAVATPLGFFTGYLMPDVFGGFAFLATANLLFLCRFLSRPKRAFWFALLAYSLLVHSVNLMTITALVGASILYGWWRRIALNRYQIGGLGACIAVALLGQVAFGQAVKAMTGAPPVRPPFIAMRLIADGPGYAYLKEHCPTEQYIYCRVLSQRNAMSDSLLWSKDRRTSLFRGLSADEQRLSAAQQPDFVKAVIADRPGEVLAVATENTIEQLARLDLLGFNYSRENRARFRDTIPAEPLESLTRTRAYRNTMPIGMTELFAAVTAALSIAFFIYLLASARFDESANRLRAFCLCILAGLVLNAVICGALSGPKGRYEMRLIWVLPLVAGAIASTGIRRRGASVETSPLPQPSA